MMDSHLAKTICFISKTNNLTSLSSATHITIWLLGTIVPLAPSSLCSTTDFTAGIIV